MTKSYEIIDHEYDVVVVGAAVLVCVRPWAPPRPD